MKHLMTPEECKVWTWISGLTTSKELQDATTYVDGLSALIMLTVPENCDF